MDFPNIIFIVIDTLRKDYARPLEDELKKLGFVSYDNGITPAPWTTPAHASIFTGVYPIVHEVHESPNKKIYQVRLNSKAILSYQLSELGYDTYLLSSNPLIRPEFGFNGFDVFYDALYIPSSLFLSYSDIQELRQIKKSKSISSRRDIFKILLAENWKLLTKVSLNYLSTKLYLDYIYSRYVVGWPRKKGARSILNFIKRIPSSTNSPKFIFVNFMEVHEPYTWNDELTKTGILENLRSNVMNTAYLQMWKEGYPRQVRYITHKLLELIRILKEKKLFDNSLVIVTSDHGQLLGEHGRIGHGTFLYDELLKVPLLIKYPSGYKFELVDNSSKYVTLVRINKFILNFIYGDISSDEVLYRDVVFSESYGTQYEVKVPSQLEQHRIAVYHGPYKGIYNVANGVLECVKSYDPTAEVTEDVNTMLVNDAKKFLKQARLKNAVKRVKFKL